MPTMLVWLLALGTFGVGWSASLQAQASSGGDASLTRARPAGDVDPLLGPATLVNQGTGAPGGVGDALRPGPEHDLLARLVGRWEVGGVEGRRQTPVAQQAEVGPLFSGAWYELRLYADTQLDRLVHFGFDRYRGSFVMWEVGRGFTSPLVRVGEPRGADGLAYWRQYTIQRRGTPTIVRERLALSFQRDGTVRWQAYEQIGDEPEWQMRDVTLTPAAR